MNITKLSDLFSSLLGFQVFAINFPSYTKGTFTKLEIISGIVEAGGVQDFNIQFMCKSDGHPSKAEALAMEIINKLDVVTDKVFDDGKYQLILARVMTPQPTYVGETTAGEYIFSVDFRLLTTKI